MSDDPTRYESRRITVQTVAAAAGVSTATVSRVLSGRGDPVSPALAERVRRAADQLSYRPNEAARGLRMGTLRNIGVVVPDLSNAYFSDLLPKFHQLAAAAAYQVISADPVGDPDTELTIATNLLGYVDGLIMLAPQISAAGLEELSRHRVPIVLVDRIEPGLNLPVVCIDHFAAMQQMCTYLADLGHRRIAYLGGSALVWPSSEQWRGVQVAASALGIDEFVIEGDGAIDTAYNVTGRALRRHPTAILCSNDFAAIGVISKLRTLGLNVPGDISVTGFGDTAIAGYVLPALTTVRSPKAQLAENAWELMHAALANESVRPPSFLGAELVARNSTGPARTG